MVIYIDLILLNCIHKSKKEIVGLYEAELYGQRCYAIQHEPTGHTELFDYDRKLLNDVKSRLERSRQTRCVKHAKSRQLLFMKTKRGELPISVRYFLYARYTSRSLKDVRGKKIMLEDDSLVKDDVLDLRKGNLYEAGAFRAHTLRRDLRIVSNPKNEGEQFIEVVFHTEDGDKVEHYSFEVPLLRILGTLSLCELQWRGYGRSMTVVHYGKGANGYVLIHTAKLVAIYKKYFHKYKNLSGAEKRFVHDVKRLLELESLDAGHINSDKSNGCFENLMLMDAAPNKDMSNFIRQFGEGYRVFAACNPKDEILIELYTPWSNVPEFFKCETVEDYLDWQLVMTGRKRTGRLKELRFNTLDGEKSYLLTAGRRALKLDKGLQDVDFWEWVEHRNRLLSMPDERFFVYRRSDWMRRLPLPDDMVLGSPVFIKRDNDAYVSVTLIGKREPPESKDDVDEQEKKDIM